MPNEIQPQIYAKTDEMRQVLDNPDKYTNPIEVIAGILVSHLIQCGMMS